MEIPQEFPTVLADTAIPSTAGEAEREAQRAVWETIETLVAGGRSGMLEMLRSLGFPCTRLHSFGWTRDACTRAGGDSEAPSRIHVLLDEASGVILNEGEPAVSHYTLRPEKSTMSDFDDIRRAKFIGPQFGAKRLLDFGCGAGGFVGLMRKLGWVAVGYDPVALGHRTLHDCVAANHIADQPILKFDVITAWHVIEHLTDPLAELRSMGEYLVEGGELVVEVPHAKSWLLHHCAAHRNAPLWSEHRILHTEESLSALLRHSGFEVRSLYYVQRHSLMNALHWLEFGIGDGGTVPWDASDHEWAARLAASKETDSLIVRATRR